MEKDGPAGNKKHLPAKLIPWEPYKAATSASGKKGPPTQLPPLIPYRVCAHRPTGTAKSQTANSFKSPSSHSPLSKGVEGNSLSEDCEMVRAAADGEEGSIASDAASLQCSEQCNNQLQQLRVELEIERELSADLKRLLVASVGDDLMCHVKSLSEDKVRLASTMKKFAAQLSVDHDRAEDLEISSDMWRCKFLAMSIRADDLLVQRARLLTALKECRSVLREVVDAVRGGPSPASLVASQSVAPPALSQATLNRVFTVLGTDVSNFCERTPCDEKVVPYEAHTSNITVTCCKHCAGREIKLL